MRLICSIIIYFTLIGCGSTPERQSNSQDSRWHLHEPRYGHSAVAVNDKIFVLAGTNSKSFLGSVEIINPQTGESVIHADVLLPRLYGTAVWDGKQSIYIIGGVTRLGRKIRFEHRVEVLNIDTLAVTFAPDIPQPRRKMTAQRINNYILVLGGSVPGAAKGQKPQVSSMLQVYNLNTHRWQQGADMPMAKETQSAVYQNQLYTLGGYNHQYAAKYLEKYDLQHNQWTQVSSALKSVSAHSMAVLNGKLYVFGDYKQLDRVWQYDFAADQWREPNLPFQPTRHGAAVTWRDKILVIGGNRASSRSALDLIQVFTP